MRNTIISVLLLSLSAVAWAGDSDTSLSLEAVLEMDHRTPSYKVRDQYRHPVETLRFFEVEPNMAVVEIFPGGGWYTEILAPYLKDNGTLYAAGNNPRSHSSYSRKSAKRFKEKMDSNPAYSQVKITVLEPPKSIDIAPAGTADRVLTFRNIHNWMKAGTANETYKAFYKALKPGGILGVVEHRGHPDVKQDPKAKSGYVNQAYAIQLAEKAGFKFVASSEINANPKDTKDHSKGVWSLPPTLAMKKKNRDRYLAIGESDRFTLKFIKPE